MNFSNLRSMIRSVRLRLTFLKLSSQQTECTIKFNKVHQIKFNVILNTRRALILILNQSVEHFLEKKRVKAICLTNSKIFKRVFSLEPSTRVSAYIQIYIFQSLCTKIFRRIVLRTAPYRLYFSNRPTSCRIHPRTVEGSKY